MNSEKLKEIKEALEQNDDNGIMYEVNDQKRTCKFIHHKDILTLINEFESENERLSKENFVLYRDRFTKKELDDISACRVIKATKELKDRIAKLEDGIAQSMLGCEFLPECTKEKEKELVEKFVKAVYKELYLLGRIYALPETLDADKYGIFSLTQEVVARIAKERFDVEIKG